MEPKSACSSIIVSRWSRQVARQFGFACSSCFSYGFTVCVLPAQQDDPSEIFLKAYLSAQQGEKLEHENRFKTALAKFRFAGSLIEELRRSHSDWQPAIVEYRGRKIGEGILRVQERISRQNELNAAASPLPEVVPSLPENEAWSEPGPEVVAPQGLETVPRGRAMGQLKKQPEDCAARSINCKRRLKNRTAISKPREKKRRPSARVWRKQVPSLRMHKRKSRRRRSQNVRHAISSRRRRHRRENSTTEQLRLQIADLKNDVALAEEARATAERQRDETNAKLAEANKQIAAAEQQRDEALAQLKTGSETEPPAQALLAENRDLRLTAGKFREKRAC